MKPQEMNELLIVYLLLGYVGGLSSPRSVYDQSSDGLPRFGIWHWGWPVCIDLIPCGPFPVVICIPTSCLSPAKLLTASRTGDRGVAKDLEGLVSAGIALQSCPSSVWWCWRGLVIWKVLHNCSGHHPPIRQAEAGLKWVLGRQSTVGIVPTLLDNIISYLTLCT